MQNIQFKIIKDANMLAALNEEVQQLHHNLYPDFFKPYNRDAAEGFFKQIIVHDDCIPLVAYADEAIAGYALIFIKGFQENPFQYAYNYILLDQLLVLKNFRKAGIGKKLINEVFTIAKKHNINHIKLNHWDLNESAGAFFLHNGFRYHNKHMYIELK